MPRAYTRKTNRASWSAQDLRNAIAAVHNGYSIRQSGRKYGVPEATIRRKMKKDDVCVVSDLGRPPVFSEEQEHEIANLVLNLAEHFYAITPHDLRKIAYDYAEVNCISHTFNKDKKLAGKGWYYLFLKRHPEIGLRKPEVTSGYRNTSYDKESIKLYFDNMESLNEKYKFTSNKIFNVDECVITIDQIPPKQLGPKGVKQFTSRISWGRGKNVTVICAFSASGVYVPPLFVFPRKRMTSALTKNGPIGATYKCSHNGWSNENLFYDWLCHFKIFVKPSKDDPVLIIIDNRSSHISLKIFNFCRDNGIILLTIPPHTSHQLQPLDVTFFGPLKNALNSESDLFMKTGLDVKITHYELAELFNRAYVKVATIEKAQSGFEAAGIFPINRGKFYFKEVESTDFCGNAPTAILDVIDDENDLPLLATVQDPSTSILPSTSPFTNNPLNLTPTIAKLPTSSATVSVDQISRIPGPPNVQHKSSGRARQKSVILTPTPNKEIKRKRKESDKIKSKRKQLSINKVQTRRIDFLSPSESAKEITILCDDQVCRIPGPSNLQHKKPGRARQKSVILTPTPKKEIVKNRESKRKRIEIDKIKNKRKQLSINKVKTTRINYSSSSESDVENEKLCNNRKSGVFHINDCLVCGEFGKDGEEWFRCLLCFRWSHSECSGWYMPDDYKCDLCLNKT